MFVWCVCGMCKVRGWDAGINSSVKSRNSQMGVICFKIFSWRGCLQKNTKNKQNKTKQKAVVEFDRRPLLFHIPELHLLPNLPILMPCRVTSSVFHASGTPGLARASLAKRAEFKVSLCFPKSLLPSPLLLGAPILRLQGTQSNRSFLPFWDYWGSHCSHLSLGIRYAEDLGFLSRFRLAHLFRKTILSGKSFLLLQAFQGSLFFS